MNKVLVVDDEQAIRQLVGTVLSSAGYEVSEAADGEEGFNLARVEKPDLIVTDVMMPKKDGYELVKDIRSCHETASMPIIMLTALSEEHDELKAFQEGVDDFVTKPFKAPVLRARVANLLARARVLSGEHVPESAPASSREEMPEKISSGYHNLDEAMRGGLPRGSNVLIIGETGVGKEVVARLIHKASGRLGNFVDINCSAIPRDLFEGELFGFKAGSFTGATKAKKGLVQWADGGTLFFDEIGDLPL